MMDGLRLYDIDQDPGETTDLSRQNIEIIHKMIQGINLTIDRSQIHYNWILMDTNFNSTMMINGTKFLTPWIDDTMNGYVDADPEVQNFLIYYVKIFTINNMISIIIGSAVLAITLHYIRRM